jgi:hypothetical protein
MICHRLNPCGKSKYQKQIMKIFIAIALIAVLASCNRKSTCPAYGKVSKPNQQVAV